ncbi:hypothetical protein DACRYDRAFT_113551 [Dacryopinax primogenitus]|uniref:Uncharacterized protein n=1 Tax=Dacryopinax primogenitus (strain DJM 731) TaxID=1858805 RepID=M5G592_DACPD|nr:uncharacterized protein DACRYDRAFT_113551 [Dacryopinax primogenitus]EJU05426.1 hypothetical protein DACRYDRAFT_113551 [Dacryopinax primogenitus]
MADSLPLDTATLAGLFSSSILYGIFVVLLIAALYILLYKRKTREPNYILIVAALAMFLVNTTVLGISFSRTDDAFITLRDAPGGPLADLQDLAQWKEVTRTALTCTYFMLADAVLIYRCYIVWGNNLWVIILPMILFIASATVDIFMVVTMANLHSGDSIFVTALHDWIEAVISLTLAQNTAPSAAGSLRPVMSIILESGVMYAASLFIFLMTYVSGSNSQYILVDCINPMIGITFTLLIVRIGLGINHEPSSHFRSHRSQNTQIQPISIAVSRHYHTDAPGGVLGAEGTEDSEWEMENVDGKLGAEEIGKSPSARVSRTSFRLDVVGSAV